MTDKRHVAEADVDLAPGDLTYTKVSKTWGESGLYLRSGLKLESTQNRHNLTRLCRPLHLHSYMTLATTPTPNAQNGRHISSSLGVGQTFRPAERNSYLKTIKNVFDLGRCSRARGASSRDFSPRKSATTRRLLPGERARDRTHKKTYRLGVETLALPASDARESRSFFGAKPSKLPSFWVVLFYVCRVKSRLLTMDTRDYGLLFGADTLPM